MAVREGTPAIFGRTYATEPDVVIERLSKDEAIAEADTLLLTIPNQLEEESIHATTRMSYIPPVANVSLLTLRWPLDVIQIEVPLNAWTYHKRRTGPLPRQGRDPVK